MVAEGATTMPISYEKRREHRLKLVEQLPPALRGKIFLRNIEAFAALPDQARQTLEKAVQSGLTQIPNAIRLLKDNPHLSAEELDRVGAVLPKGHWDGASSLKGAAQTPDPLAETNAVHAANNRTTNAPRGTPAVSPRRAGSLGPNGVRDGNADTEALATLLRSRFQSMPEIAALALAQSPSMADVLDVQIAIRQAIASPHIRSDFVFATLYGLLQSSLTQLEALIATNPAYQKALLLLLRPDPFPLAESLAAKPKN